MLIKYRLLHCCRWRKTSEPW